MVVDLFSNQHQNINYYKHQENLGFDNNILSLIEKAEGEYLWFIGDDDCVVPGAMKKIMEVLRNKKCSGMILNGLPFDFDMKEQIGPTTVMNKKFSTKSVDFNSAEAVFSELGDAIGFISANVVQRALLVTAAEDNRVEQFTRGYIHVFLIGLAMKLNPSWYYFSEPCVKWRAGNDGLGYLGEYKRLELDIIELERIILELFGKNSVVLDNVNRRICGVITAASVLNVKMKGQFTVEYMAKVLHVTWCRYRHYLSYWIKVIPFLLLPRKIVGFLLAAVRLSRR